MKRYIKTVLCTILLGSLVSCSDWFDVSPKTDIKAEDLFESETGFRNALTGIYVLMTGGTTYGSNYTFGFMEKLAQNYDRHPIQNPTDADRAVIYNYTTTNDSYNSKAVLANMWLNSYQIIANANNLMAWIDKNGNRVIAEQSTRDHMRGQALAIRALVHFDLLRCWGPCYRSDSKAFSIPYRVVVDNSKQPRLPADQVIGKIVTDLKAAEQLMLDQEDTSLGADPLHDLCFSFNVHSVRALLARVCNYAGLTTDAVAYAKLVIDHCGLSLMTNNQKDPVLLGETLFALSYYDMNDKLEAIFTSDLTNLSAQYYITLSHLVAIYEAQGTKANDIRYRNGLGFIHNTPNQVAMVRKYLGENQNAVPMIRLAEMYYILCESSPLSESAKWIDEVRNKRGIPLSENYASFASDADRLDALDLEYRKEFYAEGQYFPFLKLHKRSTFYNCPLSVMSDEEYIFPLPDDEVEYGWTNENAEE